MKNFILTLLSVAISSTVFSQMDSLKTLALDGYNEQNYVEALGFFEKCIALDSADFESYEKGGLSAYRLGDIPKARDLFLKLEKKDTLNKLAYTQLATIYEQQNNTPKAIKYYMKLNEMFPDNAIYYRKLAQQYYSARLFIDAFKYYGEAHKRNPRDLFTIKGISEMFLNNKQYNEADSMLIAGIAMDTLNINFHQLLATSKYKQKDYDSTVYYLKRIRGRVDLSPYFNKMMGYSLIQIDSFERSIPYLFKSITDHGHNEHSHYYLATAYSKLDSTSFALHHYQEALSEGISKNVDLYHRNLAKIYNEENKLKEAISHYQDAYKYGEDPLVLFYLARASDIYYKDKSIAIRYYSRFIKSGYDHAEYVDYSKQRRTYLKELKHQSGN